ncbi:MAG: hypothetical protein JWM91_3246 [Rhodospirillales bacterium]|nr:hypothetical protein [Rhodospirillales bacterium]
MEILHRSGMAEFRKMYFEFTYGSVDKMSAKALGAVVRQTRDVTGNR